MQTNDYSYGTRRWFRSGLWVPHNRQDGSVWYRGFYRQFIRGCGKYTPHQGENEMERRRNR